MSDRRQLWVSLDAHAAVCAYCNRNGAKIQTIGTKAIELGLKEIEKQEKALSNE